MLAVLEQQKCGQQQVNTFRARSLLNCTNYNKIKYHKLLNFCPPSFLFLNFYLKKLCQNVCYYSKLLSWKTFNEKIWYDLYCHNLSQWKYSAWKKQITVYYHICSNITRMSRRILQLLVSRMYHKLRKFGFNFCASNFCWDIRYF